MFAAGRLVHEVRPVVGEGPGSLLGIASRGAGYNACMQAPLFDSRFDDSSAQSWGRDAFAHEVR